MKIEKIAIYSLTAILFSLMMLVYWLPKIPTWSPTWFKMISILVLFLLARGVGNLALIIFEKNMPADIASGIASLIMFPLLLIRSNALFIFTLMLWVPATSFLIAYSLFENRSLSFLTNLAKRFSAGILVFVFNVTVIDLIDVNNPEMNKGGEWAGWGWLVLGIIISCIEVIVLITVLTKGYALQKEKTKAGNDR